MAPEMPAGDVEVGGDHLSGLADLVGMGPPAFVHGRSGGAYGAAQGLGQRFQDGKIAAAHAPAARNDDVGLGQFDLFGFQLFFDEPDGGSADVHLDLLDGPGAFGFADRHGVGPDRDDFGGAVQGQVHENLSAVHGARGRHVAAVDPEGDAVHGQGRSESRRQARSKLFALGGGAQKDHGRIGFPDDAFDDVGVGIDGIFFKRRIIGRPYRVGPVCAQLAGDSRDVVAQHHGLGPASQGRRRLFSFTQRLVCNLAESAFDLLCNYQYTLCHSFSPDIFIGCHPVVLIAVDGRSVLVRSPWLLPEAASPVFPPFPRPSRRR